MKNNKDIEQIYNEKEIKEKNYYKNKNDTVLDKNNKENIIKSKINAPW